MVLLSTALMAGAGAVGADIDRDLEGGWLLCGGASCDGRLAGRHDGGTTLGP